MNIAKYKGWIEINVLFFFVESSCNHGAKKKSVGVSMNDNKQHMLFDLNLLR